MHDVAYSQLADELKAQLHFVVAQSIEESLV